MTRRVFRPTAYALLSIALLVGCAAKGAQSSAPGIDPAVIQRDQIAATPYTNAFDLVQALHPDWLRSKGPADGFNAPTAVLVYVDGARMGGVDQLKRLSSSVIFSVRYYDGFAASARWGPDHSQGVVFVVTAR